MKPIKNNTLSSNAVSKARLKVYFTLVPHLFWGGGEGRFIAKILGVVLNFFFFHFRHLKSTIYSACSHKCVAILRIITLFYLRDHLLDQTKSTRDFKGF